MLYASHSTNLRLSCSRPVARPRRAAQKQVSYKEESEAEDEDDGDDGGLLEESDASDYED